MQDTMLPQWLLAASIRGRIGIVPEFAVQVGRAVQCRRELRRRKALVN